MKENKGIKSRSTVKQLGFTIDKKTLFHYTYENIRYTASKQLQALARIRKFL